MATVTTSIGTSGRDYSTIAAWEADLDTGGIYSSGDRAQGECYADSAFTQTGRLVMNTGNNLTGGRILTVPVGQRHDGTADSGAKVNLASGGGFDMWYQSGDGITTGPITIEWLELDGGDSEQSFSHWRVMFLTAGGSSAYVGTVSHMLIHGVHNSTSGNGGIIQGSSNFSLMHNNIVYDCSGRTQTSAFGASGKGIVCNNTAYKMGVTYSSAANPGSREAIGVSCSANNTVVKNNIAMGGYVLHSASNGTVNDFYGTDIGTYNLSGDSTATGSNSITGVSTASLFISTTSGSEDLHILRSSSAVGAGDDLGTGVSNEGISAGSSTYGSPINRDINNGDRNSRAMAWDIGASQNAIISTIGTTGREYSTVAAWLADLDSSTYYGAGSVARGECYADSTFTFTGVTTFSGGNTIDLVCKVLTAADDQRHDGTASGTHVKFSSNARFQKSGAFTFLSWLDISWTGTATSYEALRYIDVVDHCLIHDVTLNYTGVTWRQAGLLCYQVHSNIIYDINRTEDNNYPLYGIFSDGSYAMCNQNTVYNVNSVGDGATTYGIYMNFYWDNAAQLSNNIVMGTTNSGTGSTVLDIKAAAGSSSLFKTNMSSDAGSSVGTDGLTSKSAANQFVSTVNDSQDFHLLLTSDAVGAGTDLGIGHHDGYGTGLHNYYGYDWYSTGWQYDINYGNRHAFSQTWDIGASQYAIISTIGTNSRDYSTFNAWEADLDDTSYYGKGSVANGQMYKDSDYQWNGTFYMDGGATLKLRATYLTVAEGQRHDGTPNTGVRFLNNGGAQYHCMVFQLHYGSNPVVKSFEWVEMDENAKGGGGCTQVLQHYAGGWGQSSIGSYNHCMIHNYYMGNISAGDKSGVIYFGSQYGQAHH